MKSKDLSVQQEKEIAKYLGGRVQSNSGGTKFGGGDVHTKHFLIEAKLSTTPKKSFSIQKEWLEKAKEQSYEQNKLFSALAFRFEPDGRDYYVIHDYMMKAIVEILERESES